MARKIAVEIVGDSSSLERSFARSTRSAKQFNREMGRLGRGGLAGSGVFRGAGRSLAFASGGFLTGAGLTTGIKSSVTAAADLEEQIQKTNVVFGKSAEAVEAWSKTLAESFGLSEREALTLASTFGALFAPLGIVGKQAADQSRKLVELGADLASFYNTDVQDALDAIQSGLVGQARPLRRYGILLDAARVQQEALNETGKKHAADLTNQEKVLARIALIYKDSGKAQGDFARTSGDLAQQSKILRANLENLQATLGAALIPVLNRAASALNDFFVALSGGPVEGPVTGQGIETTLVPVLAKRIAAYKKAGLQGKEILRLLRLQVGDSQKANDLIAEAFRLSRDAKLRARLRQQGKDATTDTGAGDGETKKDRAARLARIRAAADAVRQEAVDRAQLAVDRAGLTKSLGDDLAALNKLNALLKRRIKGSHDTLALQQQQIGVQLQINDIIQRQADARKAAAQVARQSALDARTAHQFGILGLGPHGEERIPGARALRRELEQVSELPLGKKGRSTVERIRRLIATNFHSLTAEVRTQVKQMLDDLNQQLRQSGVDVTRFQKTARGQFVLAGAHPQGAVVINGGVHLHGIQDVKAFENALAKRAKQRAHARRSTR